MLNEIKIDRSKPVWVNVWSAKNNDKNKRIYLFSFNWVHYCVDNYDSFLSGEKYDYKTWYYIEFIKPKERIPLDSKTCPRRPVLTHPDWLEGMELYPSISADGLYDNGECYSWEKLAAQCYKINGLPASREVDK